MVWLTMKRIVETTAAKIKNLKGIITNRIPRVRKYINIISIPRTDNIQMFIQTLD